MYIQWMDTCLGIYSLFSGESIFVSLRWVFLMLLQLGVVVVLLVRSGPMGLTLLEQRLEGTCPDPQRPLLLL